jgi:hypothetical protein
MAFCTFMKDPALRFNLRKGSVKEGWDIFIPSLADKVRSDREFQENCGSCDRRANCSFCPVYGFLEHRRHSAKIDYLCSVSMENKRFKENWKKNHRRFYGLGGLIVQVDSDLPITDHTFAEKFKEFQINEQDVRLQSGLPADNFVFIRHHFSLPELNSLQRAEKIYHKVPWAIYRQGNSWTYVGISKNNNNEPPLRVATFNHDHTYGRIYQRDGTWFSKGNLKSLTMFSSDQILFSRVLANLHGCYFHSSGAIMEGQGLLFVGQSDAGKSTISRLLEKKAQVLCDDRNIVRRQDNGFHVYGTWSHGEWPVISAASAPLRAIFFLEQAAENQIDPVAQRSQSVHQLLARLIKPLETADWWHKMFTLLEEIVNQVPCYRLRFDTSGRIVEELQRFCDE